MSHGPLTANSSNWEKRRKEREEEERIKRFSLWDNEYRLLMNVVVRSEI